MNELWFRNMFFFDLHGLYVKHILFVWEWYISIKQERKVVTFAIWKQGKGTVKQAASIF